MAGVKQFDRDEALDSAMATFWTRRYEAASIDDLVAATGIGRGSLYGTFGDKRRLFLKALDRYWDAVVQDMTAQVSDPDPRRALERMFEALIRRTSDPKVPRGCLITNTSIESCSLGDEVARKISQRLGEQETGIYRVLRKAQACGALSSALDARALARFFLGVAWGINAVNRTVADPEMLRDMVRVAMSVWDNSNASPPGDSQIKPRHRREHPLP
jgi:TetR/AcrR family transcriptional repressor of nem operon